jgi:hypothetical protein
MEGRVEQWDKDEGRGKENDDEVDEDIPDVLRNELRIHVFPPSSANEYVHAIHVSQSADLLTVPHLRAVTALASDVVEHDGLMVLHYLPEREHVELTFTHSADHEKELRAKTHLEASGLTPFAMNLIAAYRHSSSSEESTPGTLLVRYEDADALCRGDVIVIWQPDTPLTAGERASVERFTHMFESAVADSQIE